MEEWMIERIEEILERVEEGTTTAEDAETLRELLKDRHQGLSKKNEVS